MTARTCVITINYRGAEDTAACINSLVTSAAPLSIVVVDNTPNDPKLKEALEPYPEVVLLRAHENLGFGRGNNLGIEWALKNTGCEFIFIFNNDATAEPNAVQKLEEAMDQHPEAGIIAPRIVLDENPGLLWYGGGEVDWRRGGGRVPGFLGPAEAPLAMTSREVSFASGCAMLIRRYIAELSGGFDPRFFMYEEDLELCLRATEAGQKIRYEPLAVVRHKGQGSMRRQKRDGFKGAMWPDNPNLAFYAYHIVRNRILNARLHAKGRNRLIVMLGLPTFIFSKGILFLMNRRIDALASMVRGMKSGFFA